MRKRRRLDSVQIVSLIICTFAALICLYPMWFVFVNSIADPLEATAGVYLWPKKFSLVAYEKVIFNEDLWSGIKMSVIYVVAGTVGCLVVSMLAAYPLTKKNLIGRKYVVIYLLISMYFGGSMISIYLNMAKLGLINTVWALILPTWMSTGNMILIRTFIAALPKELEEAAYMDGAGHWRVLGQVVVPLSKPVLAVVAIYSVVGIWNSWFSANLYVTNVNLHPVQMFLRRVLITQADGQKLLEEATTEEAVIAAIAQSMGARQIKYSVIMIVVLPIIMVYPMFQKHFVKGVMVGSLKG